MSCCICLENLSSPVSLPCGHVFCHDCLRRAVQAVQPYSTLHACPTCRARYLIAPLDLSKVPQHLRPHLTPCIRKVYIDLPPKSEATVPSSSCSDTSTSEISHNLSIEVARLRAENDALRNNCLMWRKRAEVHSSATLGLLELSKTARDQVVQVSRQRDSIHRNYVKLNHDYQRQKTLLQAVVTAMPPMGRSPSPMSQQQALVNSSASVCHVTANLASDPIWGSCPTDELHRKRARTEEDGSNDNTSFSCPRPTKIARRLETDSSNGPNVASQTVVQTASETT